MIKKDVTEVVKKFLKHFFPDCFGAALTGSAADGRLSRFSDLDILIFCDLSSHNFIETYEYEGIEIQAIIIPLDNIESYLLIDRDSKGGIANTMIKKAIIIKDRNDYIKNIQHYANDLLSVQKKVYTNKDMLAIKHEVFGRLDDLRDNDNYFESLFISLKLFEQLAKTILLCSGSFFIPDSKHLVIEVQKLNSSFLEHLTKTFEKFIITKDPTPLVSFGENMIKKLNLNKNLFCSSYVLGTVYHDEVVLQVLNLEDHREFYNKVFSIFKIILLDTSYYILRSKNSFIYENGFYIVIREDKDVINKKILPVILKTHMDNYSLLNSNNIKLCYPYNIAFINGCGIGGKKIYEKVFPHLCVLTQLVKKFYTQKNCGKSNILKSSIYVILSWCLKGFNSVDEAKYFCNYAYKNFLSRSYNVDLTSNYKQLKYHREQTIKEFEDTYSRNKNNLETLFCKAIILFDYNYLPNYFLNNFSKNIDKLQNEIFEIQKKSLVHIHEFNFSNLNQNIASNQKEFIIISLGVVDKFMDILFVDNQDKPFILYTLLNLLHINKSKIEKVSKFQAI